MYATKARTPPWKGTPFVAMTLSIKGIFETLRINDIQLNNSQHKSTSAITLNVIILSVAIYFMLSVAMLNMLC
jgi:hypothetical protein